MRRDRLLLLLHWLQTAEPCCVLTFTFLLPQNCPPSTDNEIYLRNFLPALGNYTQALYRRISATAAN